MHYLINDVSYSTLEEWIFFFNVSFCGTGGWIQGLTLGCLPLDLQIQALAWIVLKIKWVWI
jgi:hypothetical protein